MDDIARHLSISKKTLYKYFKDKSDVVEHVVRMHTSGEQCIIGDVINMSENAIDEMIRISEIANQQLQNLHPSIMFDMQKYYPESFAIFSNHKNSFIRQCILENLKRGIGEGLYRSNLEPDIITEIYLGKMDIVWSQDLFPGKQFSFAKIHLELIRYHIRGIASLEGIEYLQKRINKEKINL
jgi:AcrR family transcriptional regulator